MWRIHVEWRVNTTQKSSNENKPQKQTKQQSNRRSNSTKKKSSRQLFQLKCIITAFVDCCFTDTKQKHNTPDRFTLLSISFIFSSQSFHSIALSTTFFFMYDREEELGRVMVCLRLRAVVQFITTFNFMRELRRRRRRRQRQLYSVCLETLIIKLCIEE